jgi:flagellar capping protein FliD
MFASGSTHCSEALQKMEDQYKQKLNTMDPILQQMKRKDENIAQI